MLIINLYKYNRTEITIIFLYFIIYLVIIIVYLQNNSKVSYLEMVQSSASKILFFTCLSISYFFFRYISSYFVTTSKT